MLSQKHLLPFLGGLSVLLAGCSGHHWIPGDSTICYGWLIEPFCTNVFVYGKHWTIILKDKMVGGFLIVICVHVADEKELFRLI